MSVSIVAFTPGGCALASRLKESLETNGMDVAGYAKTNASSKQGLIPIECGIRSWTKERIECGDDLLFIGSTGIAIRSVAPFMESKTTDPAVIGMDEKGMFVIPLLSGHLGGANRLAVTIADLIGATAVITTASDVNGRFAVDNFAKHNNLHIQDMKAAKEVSACILDGKRIGFSSEMPIDGDIPLELTFSEVGEIGVHVGRSGTKKPFGRTLNLIPRDLTVGLGCRRGIPFDTLQDAVLSCLEDAGLSMEGVACMASIDLKKDEQALLRMAEDREVPICFFSAAELSAIDRPGLSHSDFVEEVTGVGNVCERAALMASGGELILPKTCRDGVTVAVAAAKAAPLMFRNDIHG